MKSVSNITNFFTANITNLFSANNAIQVPILSRENNWKLPLHSVS